MANSDYVEAGEYSEDYVENDANLPKVDLRRVYEYLDLIVSQNKNLLEDNILLKEKIISLEDSIGEKINDKIDEIKTVSRNTLDTALDIKKITRATNLTVVNLPTMDYVDNKIPFVDDKSTKIYTKGTKVVVKGVNTVCEVESSFFIPQDEYTYLVVYSVSTIVDGKKVFSNFASVDVMFFSEEMVK